MPGSNAQHAKMIGTHVTALTRPRKFRNEPQDDVAVASGLVRQHWQHQGGRSRDGSVAQVAQQPALPDVTLSGPLELRLPAGRTPLTFYLPHAVDTSASADVRVVRLAAGVTVRVAGLQSLALRYVLQVELML
jgi:hypothetical protein